MILRIIISSALLLLLVAWTPTDDCSLWPSYQFCGGGGGGGNNLRSPYVPAGYTLTFDDEFTSLSDISSSAIAYTSGIKWYNGIEQCCMSPTVSGTFGSIYPTSVYLGDYFVYWRHQSLFA
jgi:hypothetical protein